MRGGPSTAEGLLSVSLGSLRLVFGEPRVPGDRVGLCHPPGKCWGLRVTGASTGRILQKDEGLNVLLSIPDSAKVVAFKPERPGLWSIKVGGHWVPGLWGAQATRSRDTISFLTGLGSLGSWEAEGWSLGSDVGISIEVKGQKQRRGILLCSRERSGWVSWGVFMKDLEK